MPRRPRIDYPGAYHHVMNRGADRQATFRSERDHKDFTCLWAEAVIRFGIVVHAYAWMGNHYHALVMSPDAQLSETLRWIGHVYTQRFNKRHGRDGALFRGRFHSVLIDSDAYLHRVARYIERNPLEAGLATPESLVRYKWSSLQHYLNPTSSDWVETKPLLSRLGSRHEYLRHVLSDHSDDVLEGFYNREEQPLLVLGDQEFVDSLPCEVAGLNPTVGLTHVSLAEIDFALSQVRALRIIGTRSRGLAVELGQRLAGATRRELADHYNFKTVSSVSSAISRSKADPNTAETRRAIMSYLGRSSQGPLAS